MARKKTKDERLARTNAYKKKFDSENYKRIGIKIKLEDKDVIEKLESVPNKSEYIRNLIKEDIGW